MDRRQVLKLIPGVFAAQSLGLAAPGLAQTAGSNGKWQIGVNLTGISYWGTEHPFRNLAAAASRWRVQKTGGPFLWDLPMPQADAAGYPLSIPYGHTIETFIVGTGHREHLPDQLIVLYEGEGKLEYRLGARLVSRSPGRDVVQNLRGDGPMEAKLMSTAAGNHLRNVRVYASDELESTETFRAPFLERLSKMSALRFMDWMNTNDSKVETWEQRPLPNRYTQSEDGVALEFMIELANRLKRPPWFTLPHRANEDYVRKFAEMVRETLDPSLPVYIEYSNEVWNHQFEQAKYAAAEGLRLGLSSNEYEAQLRYYAFRTAGVIKIWKAVFGAQSDRVIGVMASHAANDWTTDTIMSWQDHASHADVLAIAPYFGGGFGGPERANEVADWTLERLFGELSDEVDGENKRWIDMQADIARKYNIPLIAYEGGQHLVGYYGMENNQKLEKLFHAANRDDRMGELYLKHLNHWRNAGGSLYALYASMGEFSKWGSWGLIEYEAATDKSPKWQAVLQLLNE